MSTVTRSKTNRSEIAATRFNDLCTNCRNREQCRICEARSQAIYFCEEYEAATLQGINWDNQKPVAMPMPPVEAGICVNCERRHTCSIEKPEGGIWHCEEYK